MTLEENQDKVLLFAKLESTSPSIQYCIWRKLSPRRLLFVCRETKSQIDLFNVTNLTYITHVT